MAFKKNFKNQDNTFKKKKAFIVKNFTFADRCSVIKLGNDEGKVEKLVIDRLTNLTHKNKEEFTINTGKGSYCPKIKPGTCWNWIPKTAQDVA